MVTHLLAIETSCDETAAAVLHIPSMTLLSNIVHSQTQAHAAFGGVVPEIASREHSMRLPSIIDQAVETSGISLTSIDAIAATCGPGLIGALLVGWQYAKGLACGLQIPLVAVHHLEAHAMASLLQPSPPVFPYVSLIVSGGHTALYVVHAPGQLERYGTTRDDAAGEAFDKTAKLMGLGYPGGILIDQHAEHGDAKRFTFPLALKDHNTYDFSFSGLKTAVRETAYKLTEEQGLDNVTQLSETDRCDISAGLRQAIVDALLRKAFLLCRRLQIYRLVLGGGVAANSLLRREAVAQAPQYEVEVVIPPKHLCTDNAAMVAAAGAMHLKAGRTSPMHVPARARWNIADILQVYCETV